MENVSHINPYERMVASGQSFPSWRKPPPRRRKEERKAKENFRILARLVNDTHRDLSEKGSPFRLRVHQTEEDVFLDVIALNKSQKVDHSYTRQITNDDMKTLVKRIHTRMGLILDYSV